MPLSSIELTTLRQGLNDALKEMRAEHLAGTEAFTSVQAVSDACASSPPNATAAQLETAASQLASIALARPQIETIIGKLGDVANLLRKAQEK